MMVGLLADGMPVVGVARGERQHSNIMGLVQLYQPPSSAVKQANGQNLLDSPDVEHEHRLTEEDAVMQEWQRIRMARVQCGY